MKLNVSLILIFLLGQTMVQGQGTMCQTSEPFCTGTIYTFPAGTTGYAQPGAYYGCLQTQPAPAWYHMLIEDPGNITIYMFSTPLVDIDFICWGPFSDPYDPCVAGLTANKVVDCSYSPNPTEYCDIPNGQTGEYYILLITNYSQQQCNITFSQTAGNGSTDCTILPPPVSNNGPLCVGETLELYASFVVNATYYWSGPGGFLSTQQNPVIPNVNLMNSGNYSCTITVNGNSSDPAITNVIIYSNPTANLLSPDTTVCVGTPAHAIFQFTGFGPYSVDYSDGTNTFTATGLNAPMDTVFLTPTVNPTSYTFTQVEDLHCSNNLILTDMVVGLHPAASGQISGSASMCSGESAQLTFNLTGIPPWTIVYTENGTNPQTVNANSSPHYLTVYPTSTTTYEISSVTDINCDGAISGSAVITVEPTPVSNAGSDQTIPYGAFTTLNGSGSGGSGTYQFHWEPAGKLVNPNVQNPQTINLTESTIFTLTTSDQASDCEDTDEMVVTIEGGPLGCFPSASPNIICNGVSTQLNAMASGGSGDYIYLWSSNPPGFTSDIPNPVVSPGQTTIYTVSVDDGYNLVTGNVTVNVNALPVPEAGEDITVLNGTTATLDGSASNGSGNYAYHWEPADKLEDPDIANPTTLNLYTTTLFNLTVTDLNTGCLADSPDQMTVIVTGDVLGVNPEAIPDDICLGDTTQLFALAGGGSGSYTYTWSSPGGYNSELANPLVIPSAPGSYIYTCRVFDGFNIALGSVAVNVRPQPYVNLGAADTTVCVYDTLTLDAGNPGATYQWSNGSAERTIKVGTTGIGFDIKNFSVMVTNQSGCQASDEITIIFDFAACTGIEDGPVSSRLRLYPNPGSGRLTLEVDFAFDHARLNVVDPMGRQLLEKIVQGNSSAGQKIEMSLENLQDGLYYLRFQSEGLAPVTMKYMLVR